MEPTVRLIAKFVNGNTIGVIVESDIVHDSVPLLPEWKPWQVRIGSLQRPIPGANSNVQENFTQVVSDLAAYLREHGRADERGRW